MYLKLAIPILAMVFGVVTAAQEVRFVDLSGIEQIARDTPTSLRFRTLSSCESEKEPFRHQAKVSLEWLETTDLYPHQRVGVELRVENVGSVAFKLPVGPKLLEVQQEAKSKNSEYYQLRLPVAAVRQGEAVVVAWVELYGLLSNSDSFVTLDPGEWIRVRGNVVVQRWFSSEHAATASAGMSFFKYVLQPEKNDNMIPDAVRCILPMDGTIIPVQMHSRPAR